MLVFASIEAALRECARLRSTSVQAALHGMQKDLP